MDSLSSSQLSSQELAVDGQLAGGNRSRRHDSSVMSVVKPDGSSTRDPNPLSRELVRLMDAMSAADCATSTLRQKREEVERAYDAQLVEHAQRYEAAQDRASRTLVSRWWGVWYFYRYGEIVY